MKGRIWEFDPQIYPRRLYVVKGSKAFVDEHFECVEGGEIAVQYNMAGAWAIEGCNKDNNHYCIIIWLGGNLKLKDLAHEAYHALCALFRQIGSTLPMDKGDEGSEETAAYLIGWFFDCCYRVLRGKASANLIS